MHPSFGTIFHNQAYLCLQAGTGQAQYTEQAAYGRFLDVWPILDNSKQRVPPKPSRFAAGWSTEDLTVSMLTIKLWGLEHSWSTWSIIHSNKNQIKHSEVENSPAFATCCVVPTKAPKNTSWAFIEGSFHKLETIYGLWPHPEFEPLNDHQTRWISGSLENTVTTICGQASQPLLLAVHLQTFWPTPLQLELATGTPDRVGAPNWKISLSDDSNKGLDHLGPFRKRS